MKSYLLIVALLSAASVAVAQEPSPTPTPQIESTAQPGVLGPNDYVRPDAKMRGKRFINSLVGPFALGRTVMNAGLGTWTNSPEEWGTKWEGYGRRVGSNLGKNAIRQTTTYALDEALKLDSHYYRSKNKSIGARVKNALISPVTARDKTGKRVFGLPRIAGAYTSSIIAAEAWYPARYDWKDGLKSGTTSLGFNAVFNLFKEFVWKK